MNKDQEFDFPIAVFPIEVEYQDTFERVVVEAPCEIECGRTFIVLGIRIYKNCEYGERSLE